MGPPQEAAPTTARGLYYWQVAEGLESQCEALEGLVAILTRRPDVSAIDPVLTAVLLGVKCLSRAADRLSDYALKDKEVPADAV